MARKDKRVAKKTKDKKKPKAKQPKLKSAQLKPCLDCGYKTGSAFTVPFGYADRLGTRRIEAPVAPIININLADYLTKGKELPKPLAKEVSIQTEKPVDLVKVPEQPLAKPEKDIPTAIAESFQFPSPFNEVEGEYLTEAEAQIVKPKRTKAPNRPKEVIQAEKLEKQRRREQREAKKNKTNIEGSEEFEIVPIARKKKNK